MPTDRVHRLPQQAQPRAIRPHRPQPSTSDAATQLRHARPAPNERRCTRYVTMHPLRRGAPVTSRCTRSEEVQCLQIGCTASHNKPNRGQFAPTDPNRPPRTLRHSFDMLARLRTRGAAPVTSQCTRYVAVHPLRHDAPDQKRCNAYRSGAPPPTTSPTAGNSPPQTPTVHLGRCDTASTCSPGSEREALHPLRRDAPDQKGCNAYGSGAPPHRHQACAQVASLTLHMLASNRPRPRSAALDTTAMQFSGD